LELLQVLLNKVLSDGALVELANTVSGVVMLLLVSKVVLEPVSFI